MKPFRLHDIIQCINLYSYIILTNNKKRPTKFNPTFIDSYSNRFDSLHFYKISLMKPLNNGTDILWRSYKDSYKDKYSQVLRKYPYEPYDLNVGQRIHLVNYHTSILCQFDSRSSHFPVSTINKRVYKQCI